MTQTPTRPQDARAGAPAPRRRTRRRPLRRLFIVTHRWLSLVLGLVLLVITVSGSVLLYRPELQRAMHADAYDVSGRAPTTSMVQALDTVRAAHPGFDATGVNAQHGVYSVTGADETWWNVDPGTGKVLGHVGKEPTWIAFTDNLHECFLSCEGEPGAIGALTKEVPGTGWLGFDGAKVTWGGLVLLVLGLLLVYLSLTGVWLWFPRPRRWRSSMSVRWRRGRFARDTDLHKVAGMVALLPLLVWAVTGMSYESALVEKAWYAVTPGGHEEDVDAVSAKGSGPDVGIARATAAAEALHPDARLVTLALPAADDPTSAYTFYFAQGYDPYDKTEYPGDLGVFVDRHTGVAKDNFGSPGRSLAQDLWDTANFPVHSGYIVNGWWRLLWLALGLSPLLLAVTGVSTWLVRRRTRRVRRQAQRAGEQPPAMPAALVEELGDDPETAPDLADAVVDQETVRK